MLKRRNQKQKKRVGGDQVTKQDSRRTEDWRSQSKNESRPEKENQRRKKKGRETGGQSEISKARSYKIQRKPSRLDALLELVRNRDRSIVTVTGSKIFLPKRIFGTKN